MNNIPQKNIIFENSRNNGLPYYNAGSIQYVGGQNINFATLNNTFQQLIDNDLYAENYIRNYAEHVVGPKSSAPSAVYAGAEGYKAFSDDGVQMHIYRKHENPLSQSVSCVLPDVCANFIAQTGQYVIVGCDDGVYFEQNGFHRLADDKPAYGKYFSDQANLIASNDGVYSLIMKPGYDISQYHLFVKLNANDIGVCRSVYYIDETHTVVVGTDTGIYEGTCYSYMLGREDVSCTVVFSKMKMVDGTQTVSVAVNALTASGNVPIAATSNGLFKPDKIYDFTGYGSVLSGHDIRYRLDDGEKWIIGAEDGIYQASYTYDGYTSKFIDLADSIAAVSARTGMYFATSSGIFRYADGQIKTLIAGLDGINSIQVYAPAIGDFPVFSKDSAIYYMGNDDDYTELTVFDNASVNDIYINKHELFAATTVGLYKYRLYAGNIEYDSEKIVSSEQVYQSIVDNDFGPSGLIEVNGNLYAYSGKGIRGLTNPSDFVDISADHCCEFKRDDGSSLFIVSAGKDAYVFDDKLFKQSHIQAESNILDIKATSNMILFRLADKTLWQIHKKDALAIHPELTRVQAYTGIDDFTTYKEFAAVRQNTQLKFLQEYTQPEMLGVLSGYPVNGLQYNQTFNTIFVSTSWGLSAIDMSVIDPATSSYAVQRVYPERTYGCWSSQDKLYNFTLSGVDVYDIVKTVLPSSGTEDDAEATTVTSCVYKHTVMKNQKKVVNGMCELDGRQLYATTDGLYASVLSANYEQVVPWSDNIQFCYKTTLSVEQLGRIEDLFICYDSNGALFRYYNGNGDVDTNIKIFTPDLSITGCAASNYDDDCLYIATSISGLYMYNVQTGEFVQCGDVPVSANIVGISNVRYNTAGGSEVIVACVYNAENTESIGNKIFIEADKNVFREVVVSQNIIDENNNDELVHVEFLPADGINSAQLFMYMRAYPQSGEEKKVKVVSISRQGGFATDCDVSAELNAGYDRVCASSDRFVYMTRRSGSNGVQAYVYAADAPGTYEERVTEIPDVDQIFNDTRGGVYVRKGTNYYKAAGSQLERLLISDSGFSDKIIGLEYYDWRSGYALIKQAEGSGIGGVYKVQPDDTQATPIRTNFENKQLYSIYNAFGLIVTAYNNKLYWSDVSCVEDLADSRNYNEITSISKHFTGCCVSEEMNTVYAYGTKFVASWHATNKSTFISNASNYTLETYDNIAGFTIQKVIPHESYTVDLYLKNSVGYVKPYLLPGSGIYIYNSDNVQMLIKPSALVYAANLFQAPDGILYMAARGVMHTINCENAEQFSVHGVTLTGQTQDIKYDGKNYYVRVNGRWYYVYHNKLTLVPGVGEITDILRHAESVVRVQDGKFFRFEYAKIRRVTAEEIEHAIDGYDTRRIFMYENELYYKVQSAGGFQLIDERYAPIRIYFADRPGLQVFEDVCLAKTGGLILIQATNSIYYCERFDEVAQKYNVEDIVFPTEVYIKNGYTGFDSRSGIAKFNRYGVVNVYRRVDDSPVNFTKILGIDDDDFLICSSEGLYRYIQDFVYKMSGESTAVGCIYMDMFEDIPGYVTSNNSDIYRSSDLIDWRFLFSSGVVGDIHDIYVKSLNDYYVATSVGVVKTIYSYEMINDIEQRNEYELQAVVDSLADNLDITFDNQLDDHLTKWHSPQSQMYFVNSMLLSVDMSGISEEWQSIETGTELVIENDLVDVMEFGDLSSFGCEISTENSIFSQSMAPAEYVFKRYMSGVSELLVHVQTTKTYYLNGVPGSPAPREESEVVSRKNLESITGLESSKKKQNSSVPDHATKITLRIPKSVTDISEVHDVQICPGSLPLKIYSDNVDVNDMEKNGIFNSKVIPSIALPYEMDDSGIVFNFRCFGTDEQSIRIQFTEIRSSSNGFVTVEFQSGGGAGTMPVQRIPIGVQTYLSKSKFVNDGKFFLGWSISSSAGSQSPTYMDGQQVVLSQSQYNDGDTLVLYAIWTIQDINGDANIFGIESDGTPLYIKDAIEVSRGNTIIDYGDGSEQYIPSDDSPVAAQQEIEPEPEVEVDGDYLTEDDMSDVQDVADYQSLIDGISEEELDDGSIVKP